MVRQLRGRDFTQPPEWVRKFTLASIATAQSAPIFIGGFILSVIISGSLPQGSGATGRLLIAILLICSGTGVLVSVYRDWRYREPFHRSTFFLASIALPILAMAVLSRL